MLISVVLRCLASRFLSNLLSGLDRIRRPIVGQAWRQCVSNFGRRTVVASHTALSIKLLVGRLFRIVVSVLLRKVNSPVAQLSKIPFVGDSRKCRCLWRKSLMLSRLLSRPRCADRPDGIWRRCLVVWATEFLRVIVRKTCNRSNLIISLKLE